MTHLRRTAMFVGRPFVIVALVLGVAVVSVRADGAVIDFATQDPDLLIAGDAVNENLGTDFAVGDLDGDGIDDLVIGAPWAHRASDQQFAGHVYVFFGGEDRPASLNSDSADVAIIGAAAGDAIGGGVDRQPGTITIGDVNDDAIDDLVLGAPDARGGAGEVRVIFGGSRTDWETTPTIDLSTMPGDVVITGADANDGLGSAVAVGDMNGDDSGDLIAGAPRADGPGNNRTDAGEVYVFFGQDSWPGTLLAEDHADARVVGARQNDFLGSGLAVGQLGGAEIVDVAIGARGGAGPDGDRTSAGEVHVLFGSTSLTGTRDFSATPADWIVYGADSIDDVGRYLAVGDVSGDGQPDLVIGVSRGCGPANGRTDAGEVAVLFGPQTSGATSDLADGADFVLYGPGAPTGQVGNRLGDSITLGDFNGDGVMDVFAGARQGDGFDDARLNAGEAYVILGGDLPPFRDLSAENADIAIFGRDSGDFLGRTAAGNLDGVPPDDLVLGAHRADVMDGSVLRSAGEVFVVYRQPVEPTPPMTTTPTLTSTLTPTPTPTGTPSTPTPATFDYLPLLMKNHSGR